MSGPGFILHPEAAQDITEIWEYIANDSRLAARRVREDIVIRVRDYLIAYAPDEKPPWIIAVMHGHRSLNWELSRPS